MSDPDQGNFLTGFTFGLFAGAAGYFLFGTEKGEQLRLQLAEEWEQAKLDLAESGTIDKNHSIRDVINLVLTKITENIEAADRSSVVKGHKLHREKKETKKFRGV